MKNNVDELLQKPYRVIDILPEQVPRESKGQFFEIESYFLEKNNLTSIKQKHINMLLKLNCYYQVSIDGDVNLSPERIVEDVRFGYSGDIAMVGQIFGVDSYVSTNYKNALAFRMWISGGFFVIVKNKKLCVRFQ